MRKAGGRRRRSVFPAFPFCLFTRFSSFFSCMSALLLVPLAATSVGGAIALGALFHYFNGSNEGARSWATESATLPESSQVDEETGVSALETAVRKERERSERAVAELESRRRELADFYARANAELEARRATLETLTAQATEAATTLGRVLDSFSTAFGPDETASRRRRKERTRNVSSVDARLAQDAFEPLFALEDELLSEVGAVPRTRRR